MIIFISVFSTIALQWTASTGISLRSVSWISSVWICSDWVLLVCIISSLVMVGEGFLVNDAASPSESASFILNVALQ